MSRKCAAGEGNIRKKTVTKNGSKYTYWEARYTAGIDPGTGKQIQKSVSGKTQKEVRDKLLAVKSSLADGTYVEPSKMTVEQWLDKWLSEYCGDKKWSTQKHYKAQVKAHIKPALGAVKLSSLTPSDIQKFYNTLLKDGHAVKRKDKNGKTVTELKPLKAKSVRNIHVILTKALSVAMSFGIIKFNPCSACTPPRVEPIEIKPLTDEQVFDLIRVCDEDEYSHVFMTILFTGLRVGEALGLTWDCVDFKTNRLIINKQLQKRPIAEGSFTYTSLKNDKTRIIAPAPFVMNVLMDRKQKQIEDRLKAGSAWEAWSTPKEQETAAVFTNALGQHPSQKRIYLHLKKLASAIGAPEARVHDLRHTYAVLSLQNGDDVKTVQTNLGHATAAFTLDVYGHVSERMKDISAARMQNYIDNLKQA